MLKSKNTRFDKGILSLHDRTLVIEPQEGVIELLDENEYCEKQMKYLCEILGVEKPESPKMREVDVNVNIEID